MRVLVVGTVPPPGGRSARALGKAAARLVGEGHEVEVLSPDLRSAAHHHSRLTGFILAMQLVRMSRRFDALVLRIQPDVPLRATTGRSVRALTFLLLGLSLRLYRDVTVRLDSPIPLPGGLGGRSTREFWRHVGAIVVENELDAQQVLAVPGVTADRVTIDAVEEPSASRHFDGWDIDPAGNLREDILVRVRSRAARDRSALAAHDAIEVTENRTFDASGFAGSRATNPNFAGIARFGLARAKRLVLAAGTRLKA